MKRFVDELARWDRVRECLVHRSTLPPQPAQTAEPAVALSGAVRTVLERMGVERLYTHQAEALDLIRAGRDVAVVTPTASGKSLVFHLPTIEAALEGRGARSLYLFPYKALEQDQHQSLMKLGRGLFSGVDLTAEIYDGDTAPGQRRTIKAAPPDVLITNPDMLHLGILSYHSEWKPFFENLRYVVVDELHVYRGIFGSHLAHVLRRLWRVCSHHGSRPQVIACSATVGNPAEFAAMLTGRPMQIVTGNGAPRAGRHFIFLNPHSSPYTEATAVLGRAVEEGYKTIAFTKARKVTELIHSWLVRSYPHLRGRVASYRAGYLPEERREIERRLFRGDLGGVVSTSALELGIDVGELDVCILVGYPGSIMSSWQRIGRVGRSGRESLTVLIALPDALDQYFMKRPEEFFQRPVERAVLDPGNKIVASAHLVCAGAELPIGPSDRALYPGAGPLLEELVEQHRLLRGDDGERLFSLKRHPQRDVSLRSAGQPFVILDVRSGRSVGSIDGVRVFHECHEGAIYLHGGRQYRVARLDTQKRRVEVEPSDEDYYTQAVGDKETEILETWSVTRHPAFRVGLGRLKVTVRISAYERRRIFGQEILSRHPLELPPIVFETVGFWLVIPEALERLVTRREGHFMGTLHAAEHTMISLFPLLALCDRGDIGGISYSLNAQLGSPAIFIYDGYPGGIGLTERVHDDLEELLERTIDLLESCPCEEGCPSCVQSPKCGSGNRPLDKGAARIALAVLTGRESLEEAGPLAEPRPAPELAAEGFVAPAEAAIPAALRVRSSAAPIDAASISGETVVPGSLIAVASGITILETPVVPPLQVEPARLPLPEDGRLVFFDLETQRGAEDVGGWWNLTAMGLALAVVYEPARREFRTYGEVDVQRLLVDLLSADKVVGYNIERFDLPVLSSYTPYQLHRVRTLDMLAHMHGRFGFRMSLGHLADVNLGEGKSADGLQSLRWFREGRLDLIETYCRKDVEITARLFFLARERGYLLCRDSEGRAVRLPVTW